VISKHGHKFQCDAVYANELVDRQVQREKVRFITLTSHFQNLDIIGRTLALAQRVLEFLYSAVP